MAQKLAANLSDGKDTNWGKLTPKQQRAVKEHAVAMGHVDSKLLHNNSLKTKAQARGYILRDRDTGEILKYGETT